MGRAATAWRGACLDSRGAHRAGGLGDVMGALPKALARRGHRVMVVAPRYADYAEGWETGVRRRFRVFNSEQEVCSLLAVRGLHCGCQDAAGQPALSAGMDSSSMHAAAVPCLRVVTQLLADQEAAAPQSQLQ